MNQHRNRFDGRAENYDLYRTNHPVEIFETIEKIANLKPGVVIADLGMGTGKSCQWFLEKGYSVMGVEPNLDMIQKAKTLLGHYTQLQLINCPAEQTSLNKESVDLIISGQAIQYFDIKATQTEIERILKPGAKVALFWYVENPKTPFEKDYYQLVNKSRLHEKQGNDIRASRESKAVELLSTRHYQHFGLEHLQHLDTDALIGRTLSSSHIPQKGTAAFETMMTALNAILEKYKTSDGQFHLNYISHLFITD